MPQREVAIVGLGIVSCLGTGREAVCRALEAGESGIVLDTERRAHGFRSALTGRVRGFEPPPLPRKRRKTMPDFALWAWGAALEAMEQAGWDEAARQGERTGLIVGNDSATRPAIEGIDLLRREGSTLGIGSGLVFQSLNSTVTMNLNVLLGNRGASWTVSGACASGGHALGQAAELIASGRQDRVLAGGVQEIDWRAVAAFDATNAFSLREDAPEAASRPFDAARDGLVPSGGAAMLCLEDLEQASARGADILGRIESYAFSADGQALALPSGEGLGRAMRECLERARRRPEEVDYVAAHATSTPRGDAVEARAIADCFGAARPWVASFKALTGHEMWMAGAAQAVYVLLMARAGFVAPNRNLERPDPDMPPLRIPRQTVEAPLRRALLNAAGFGGTNSCLLMDTRASA